MQPLWIVCTASNLDNTVKGQSVYIRTRWCGACHVRDMLLAGQSAALEAGG